MSVVCLWSEYVYIVRKRRQLSRRLPIIVLLLFVPKNLGKVDLGTIDWLVALFRHNFQFLKRTHENGEKSSAFKPPPVVPWYRPTLVKCSSWAHWRVHSELPDSVNWTYFASCYGRGATGEIDKKSAIILQCGQFDSKFSGRRGRSPPIIFAQTVRPTNIE